MKRQIEEHRYKPGYRTHTLMLWSLFLLILLLTLFWTRTAAAKVYSADEDRSLREELLRQLNQDKLELNFPVSVKRLYHTANGFPLWLVKEPDVQHTWAAMLMMDCVLQFGLNQSDFHPKELLYSKLHDILERPDQVSIGEKAQFEIYLSDAVLSFAAYLHFGKYNPYLTKEQIDNSKSGFDPAELVKKALHSADFMETIASAQPKDQLYKALQDRLHVVAGVQLGDCYEFPEAQVRKIALNMERLRWAALDTDNFIQVNIPSYQLSFFHHGKLDTFRVVIGKPANPTPTLKSAITYFTIAPEWRVPKKIFERELLPKAIKDTAYLNSHHYMIYNNGGMLISPSTSYLRKIKENPDRYHATQSAGCDNALGQIVFRFANIYDIYLHDSPERELFYKEKRALSHGCIRVQSAARLASLIMANDGQSVATMNKALELGNKKNFRLIKPLPIAVTYLTCEIKDGAVITLDDVYGLDPALDIMLYRKNDPALKITQN
ncbi:L,D-transpeptidase scaffold domain-containing protein [Mucilaginibacter conchicola]|nr:L,D-transpeptidase family protein [Mucilaginibacter conchicola]